MLSQVTAIRFDRVVGSGRTKPCLVSCLDDEEEKEIDLVVKFAAGCDMGVRSLVAEALSALLAADLDLPVPEPFLVLVESDFAATIPDPLAKVRAEKSLGLNFGSLKLPPGFAAYPRERPLPKSLLTAAAEILAFDTFIANDDRRECNPNLLQQGAKLAIFDHDAALQMDLLISWRPPWEPGGVVLHGKPNGQKHIFLEELRGKPVDLTRFGGALAAISPARLVEYRRALPDEWIEECGGTVDRILDYFNDLRDNIEAAILELTKALR